MPGEEIFYLSVSELARRIESKKLSPVNLTQAYLDRSQKLGPRFNAYARLTPESALEQAKAAEKEIQRGHYRGPLHGIPYAAKDLLAVKGVRTTYGRVSRYGAMALAPSMDKIGPMARSAEDCARIFAAIAGHDPKDRGTVPIDKGAFTYSPSMELHPRPLKIGWLTNAWKSLEPGVAKPVAAALKAIKKQFSSVK